MSSSLVDANDLIQPENHATRIPVVLCLDVSGSMGENGGYEALNEGVEAFYTTCKEDPVNRYGFDVAVVSFGGNGVEKVQDFMPIWNCETVPKFERPTAGPKGTPLGEGIDLAMQGLQARKDEYKENGISYYQPFLVIITDGQSTEIMEDCWDQATYLDNRNKFNQIQENVVDLQKTRKLKVIAIGVGKENYSELANFVVDKKVILAKDFSAFGMLFEFMSQSMSDDSSNNGVNSECTESPQERIVQNCEDEGNHSLDIEDFKRDED